jgi:hypothetical protein
MHIYKTSAACVFDHIYAFLVACVYDKSLAINVFIKTISRHVDQYRPLDPTPLRSYYIKLIRHFSVM